MQENEASVTRVQVCLPIPAEARASRKAMLVAVAAMFQARLSKDIDSNSRNHQGGILLRAQSAPIHASATQQCTQQECTRKVYTQLPPSVRAVPWDTVNYPKSLIHLISSSAAGRVSSDRLSPSVARTATATSCTRFGLCSHSQLLNENNSQLPLNRRSLCSSYSEAPRVVSIVRVLPLL